MKKVFLIIGIVLLILYVCFGLACIGLVFQNFDFSWKKDAFIALTIILVIYVLVCWFIVGNSLIRKIRQDIKRKRKEDKKSKIVIPDTCPHCRNPNTNKTLVCEWCGNKIC